MSTSIGFDQFAQRMAIQATAITKNITKTIQRAAVAADAALVTTTPVDTGRAKGNWNVGVGSVDTTVTDNTDAQVALNNSEEKIKRWKLGDGIIYISNSLPYIIPLENGSSAHRPEGMTQHGLDAARAQLTKGKLLG